MSQLISRAGNEDAGRGSCQSEASFEELEVCPGAGTVALSSAYRVTPVGQSPCQVPEW